MNTLTINKSYQEADIIPDNQRFYTVTGQVLTQAEYQQRAQKGAEQCRNGQCVLLEHLRV